MWYEDALVFFIAPRNFETDCTKFYSFNLDSMKSHLSISAHVATCFKTCFEQQRILSHLNICTAIFLLLKLLETPSFCQQCNYSTVLSPVATSMYGLSCTRNMLVHDADPLVGRSKQLPAHWDKHSLALGKSVYASYPPPPYQLSLEA